MVTAKTPFILKKIYYSLIWDLKNGNKEVYITFDDGPNPDITPHVLDILDTYKAKATFFCIGRNIERHTGIYERILKNGHTTGNHTFSHLKGWITPNVEYYSDIELANTLIKSPLFRPPYGKIKRSQLKHLRMFYNIIMWDVMSSDFNQTISKEKCLQNVICNTKPGSIVVFHDSPKAGERMMYALPRTLEFLTDKGYTTKTIPQHLSLLDA